MMTKFSFYNSRKELKQANLLYACEFNNKQYIVYELEDEKDDTYDIMHVGQYKKVNDNVFILDVSKDEMDVVKNQISLVMRSR